MAEADSGWVTQLITLYTVMIMVMVTIADGTIRITEVLIRGDIAPSSTAAGIHRLL